MPGWYRIYSLEPTPLHPLQLRPQHGACVDTRDGESTTGMYVFTDTDRRVGGPRIYPGLFSPGCWVLLGAGLLNSDTPLDLRHHRLYSARPKRSAETCTSGRTCGKQARLQVRPERRRAGFASWAMLCGAAPRPGWPRSICRPLGPRRLAVFRALVHEMGGAPACAAARPVSGRGCRTGCLWKRRCRRRRRPPPEPRPRPGAR